tara:strand:+ start:13868 stop:14212 length:345 start_codon:yes stop_codon:yes gene_type:complete
MKLNLIKLTVVSAVLGGFTAQSAQADDLATQYMLDREAQSILRSSESAEARRIPAFVRIDKGLTVYSQESHSDAMSRHDETRSRVFALHSICGKPAKLIAGHGLAPNLHRITRR